MEETTKELQRLGFSNFGRVHKLAKRSIVRGIQMPDVELNKFKERPVLIISDIDESFGQFNAVGIQVVPITSNPYTDFDIPILSQHVYSKSQISFITTTMETQFCFSDKLKFSITSCCVCPDRVFDLVIAVKKLLLNGNRESYHEARELVRQYRIEFMMCHGLKSIYYKLDPTHVYFIYDNGEEAIVTCKPGSQIRGWQYIDEDDLSFDWYENDDEEDENKYKSDNNTSLPSDTSDEFQYEKETIGIVEKSNVLFDSKVGYIENEDYDEVVYKDPADSGFINPLATAMKNISLQVEEAPAVKKTDKKKVTKKTKSAKKETKPKKKSMKKQNHVMVSKSSDRDLINFIKLIKSSASCTEVAELLGVSYNTVQNRFDRITDELKARNLSQYIIEWPFSRKKD